MDSHPEDIGISFHQDLYELFVGQVFCSFYITALGIDATVAIFANYRCNFLLQLIPHFHN